MVWRKWRQKLVISFRKAQAPKRALPPFVLQTLEPKLLLSAELAGGVAADLLEPDHGPALADQPLDKLLDHWQGLLPANNETSLLTSPGDTSSELLAILPEQSVPGDDANQWLAHAAEDASAKRDSALELIIVDPNTPDYLSLMNGLQQDSEREYLIYMLDGERDGIAQVSELLEHHRDLDAVHLISHGNEDGFQIGGSWLSQNNLSDYETAISQWRSAFDAEADILIYGCDLAANENGQALVDALAELTGADVAASNDITGHVDLGGDWDLEYQRGEVATEQLFTAQMQQSWQFGLGVPGTNNGFMFTTKDAVSGLPTEGTTAWGGGEIVEFSGSDLNLEATNSQTEGSFASLFNLNTFNFGGDSDDNSVKTNAVHFVTTNLTIGTINTFDLEVGDVLLAVDKNEGFTGSNGLLEVNDDDLFLFRPDTVNDYSSGEFYMLLEDLTSGSKTLQGISLIEQDVTIGSTALSAGDFIFSQQSDGGVADEDIQLFETINVGSGTTLGTTSTLIEGSELNFSSPVYGLEVVEEDTRIGGQAFAAGDILVALERDDDDIGSNALSVAEHDVFRLDISTTTLDGGASAVADIVFDGSDAGLGDNDTELYGLTMLSVNEDPAAVGFTQSYSYVEGSGQVSLDGIVVSDITSGDTLSVTLTISDTSHGSLVTGTYGSATSTYSSSTGIWSISGSLSDVNAALADLTFVPASTNTSTTTINTHVEDAAGNGPDSDGTLTLNVLPKGLWFSTNGPASYDQGSAGNSEDILSFAGSGYTLEDGDGSTGTTDGAFTAPFTLPENVRALHYVSSAVTVDTLVGGSQGTYELSEGQIVLSMRAADKNDFDVPTVGGGTISVNNTDLLVYTPSTGVYEFLLEDAILKPDSSEANIHAVSIVEQETSIGVDTTLSAGTYLIARSDGTVHADISTYNNTDGRQDLLLGADFLSDADEQIQGLELIEQERSLGGQTLAEGSLLITVTTNNANPKGGSVDDPLTIGSSGGTTVSANQIDVVMLTINATEQDSTPDTNVDAQILFDGSDISFAVDDGGDPGEINGLTLAMSGASNMVPTATNMDQIQAYTEGNGSVELDNIVISDPNVGDVITATLTLNDTDAGSLSTGTFGSSTSTYTSATGVWTVSGTLADVNNALANVAFVPATNHDTNTSITTHIEDDSGTGPADGTITLNVTPQNDAPTATNMSHTVNYSEGDSSVNLNNIVVTDVDTGDTISARLTLNDHLLAGSLSTGTYGGATSTFNSLSGIWRITGTLAEVNAALADVEFNPLLNFDANTTITTHIEDAAGLGPGDGTINLNVTTVNDVPSATNLTQVQAYTEGADSVALDDIVVTDVDNNEVITATLTLVDTAAGSLSTGTFGASTSSYSAGTGVWTVTGTVDDVNAALAAVAFEPATDQDTNTSITTHIEDAVGATPGDGSISLNVMAQNDSPTLSIPGQAFINEIHYDNVGIDTGEAIEIAGVAGTDLSGWSLVLYTGADGTAYDTVNLSDTIADQADGYGTVEISFPVNGIENALAGLPDGLALVDDSGVVRQFLSYGGTFTATDGPASGLNSTDIGVRESGSTAVGQSLQLTGSGTSFTWSAAAETFGTVNAGQSFAALAALVNQSVDEDASLIFNAANGNAIVVGDIDAATDGAADPLSVTLGVSNGTLTLGGVSGLGSVTGNTTNSVTLTGSVAELNAALEGLSYQPTAHFNGNDTLNITVDDQGNSGAGNTPSAVGAINITVNSLNDTPAASNVDQTIGYTEGAASVTLGDIVVSDADSGETVTATLTLTDIAAGRLTTGTFGASTSNYTAGTGVWTVSGSVADVNAALAAVAFVPETDHDTDTTINVHIEDAAGASPADGSIDLNVTPQNDVPTVDNAIANQNATEDSVFSFTFAANTFGDVDTGDSLSYSAQLFGGGALPSWLSFDAGTRTFSGTPQNDDVGSILVTLTANDGNGGSVSDDFWITVANSNDAPTGSGSLTATTFDDNDDYAIFGDLVVSDVDSGESDLVLRIVLSDPTAGTILGGGLTNQGGGVYERSGLTLSQVNNALDTVRFEPSENLSASGSFTSDISVLVDDLGGDGFQTILAPTTVTVNAVNDAPTVNQAIPDQNATEDTAFSFIFASGTFGDVDAGDTLSYTAQLSGGGALPTWLSFNDATRTFSGTPLNADVGTISVQVIAEDSVGATVSDTFDISVANTNDSPTGDVSIDGTPTEDQTLTANTSALADDDGLGTLSYQWLRDGVSITGATASSYTLGDDDVATDISVQVEYTDARGTAESVTSAPLTIANVNDAPSGSVSITGSATLGATLTASNNLADDDGLGTISYQWQRNGIDILGATGSTYTLGLTDVAASIRVAASYTDGQGTLETSFSSATALVTAVNNAPTGSVTINGTATEDNTLTADASALADADGLGTFSYQWQRDGVNIDAATASTYTLGDDDVGAQIRVIVSYTDGGSTAESVTSDATSAVANINDSPTGGVSIDGIATEDQTLTANTGALNDNDGLGSFAYQWLRDGSIVDGATSSTYTLGDADAGRTVSVRVDYTDAQGTAESVTSNGLVIANVNDAPTGTVSISGTATEDNTLTADTSTLADADGLGALNYQWQRDGVNIDGATASTYTLGDADVGTSVRVIVSYTDGGSTTESVTSDATAAVANVNDSPTGGVSIDGIASEDQTLTVNTGALNDNDGLGTFTYQWLRDGSVLGGATSATYTLGDDDVGRTISVRVDYVDAQDTAESVTSSGLVINNVNDAPTGAVSIVGTVIEDSTLTADTSALADADGLGTLSYLWQRDGVDISGATASTYTLGDDDVDALIGVTVSYTDGGGESEQLSAVTSATVVNVNDPLQGQVKIKGSGLVNERLVADISRLSDADGIDAVSYQWLRGGVVITGATGASYTPSSEDDGQTLSVQVSALDSLGNLTRINSSGLTISVATEVIEVPEFTLPEESTPEPVELGIDALDSQDESEEETLSSDQQEEESAEEEEGENTEEGISEFLEEAGFEKQASFIDQDRFELTATSEQTFERIVELASQNIETRNIDVFSSAVSSQIAPEEEAAYQPGVTDILSVNDPLLLVRSTSFLNGLDDMREELNEGADVTQAVVGSSLAVSAGMSAGYVAWLARSGVLLSSVISSMPVWRFVDPLPVLTGAGGAAGGDGESLESLVAGNEAAGEGNENNENSQEDV